MTANYLYKLSVRTETLLLSCCTKSVHREKIKQLPDAFTVIYSNEHWYHNIVDTVFMPRPRRHDFCNVSVMTKTKQLLHCNKQNNTIREN